MPPELRPIFYKRQSSFQIPALIGAETEDRSFNGEKEETVDGHHPNIL